MSQLLDAVGNQSDFWKKVNQIASKRTRTANTIPIQNQHFRRVLETNESVNHEVQDNTPDQVVDNIEEDVGLINDPITKKKVTIALISLKNDEAPGPDGLIGDFFFFFFLMLLIF